MKKVIVVALLLVSGLMLVGCGKTEKNLDYFKKEVIKIDASLKEKDSIYKSVGAKDGTKLTNTDDETRDSYDTIDIYFFDKDSDIYKDYETGEELGNYDKDTDVRNGYVIFINKYYDYYDEVMKIFNELD